MNNNNTSRLCVKNIPKYISEKRLRDIFSVKGDLTDVRIMKTRSGKSRRFCFIGYRTEAQAKKALEYFDRSYIDTAKLTVEYARPQNSTEIARPWSRYSKGSSAYELEHMDEIVDHENKINNDNNDSNRVKSLTEEKLQLVANDPQFEEFLAVSKSRTSTEAKLWANDDASNLTQLQKLKDRLKVNESKEHEDNNMNVDNEEEDDDSSNSDNDNDNNNNNNISDMDFLRNKSVQFEEEIKQNNINDDNNNNNNNDDDNVNDDQPEIDPKRLFIRNLPYTVVEDDLRRILEPFGEIIELHLPLNQSNRPKGFAFVTYENEEMAKNVLEKMDKTVQLGRLIHILPGRVNINDANNNPLKDLDDDTLASMTYKKKREIKQRAEAAKSDSWNSLFIRSDTVVEAIATQFGITKEELLDRSNDNLAVRLALAETKLINETNDYFKENGVNLKAFEGDRRTCKRSNNIIIVKNIPAQTTVQDISKLFAKYGHISRVLLPPSKVIAIVEFIHANEAKQAFRGLAYRKFMHVPIYLEWAPLDALNNINDNQTNNNKNKINTEDINEANIDHIDDNQDNDIRTLFIKNVNFETKEQRLSEVFSKFKGFRSVRIATKPNPRYDPNGDINKHPDIRKSVLSRGYAFVEYDTAKHAKKAMKHSRHVTIDGHELKISMSTKKEMNHKNKTDKDKITTKLIVKNIPFEASPREVRELFNTFGQVQKCRLPRKIDGQHRGFGFVDFVTKEEAANAFNALKNTHLYGRHLVVDYAQNDEENTANVEFLNNSKNTHNNTTDSDILSSRPKKRIKLG